MAWADLLSRLERLESRALPQLGSVVVLMGFTLDESLRNDGFQPGWLKVHGQPAAYEEPPLFKAVPRPAKAIVPSRPIPPPRPASERLHLAALGSILTPFGKTGQTFGQMLGLTLQAGYSWHEPWVVMGSIGLFSADAQIQRAKEQPQSGSMTLIPVSVLLTYPFRTGSKTQPFVGVGPAVEFQNLTNASLFDAGLTGNTSTFAFGYEVRSGATIAIHRGMGLTLELAWQAAEAQLAASREGTGIRFSAGLGF
ncbi:MAG: outer membrane beta-barrel protein [Nitrospirae bacterium]|nr:outer membrane beta-barrel protein [Nitrospirota bacterium]